MVKKVEKEEIERTNGNRGIGGKRGGKSQKDSGNYFEHIAEEYFNTGCSTAKRIIGSGSFGKITHDPNLLGDVRIEFQILKKAILADAKFGYGGEKQLTLKKEWLEKISEEAVLTGKYPAILGKFKGARGNNAKFIVFSWDTFIAMMQELTDYVRSLEK